MTVESTAHNRGVAAPMLRTMTLDDYPQVQALEASFGLKTLHPSDWSALWRDNPVRRRLGDRWPLGWVLEDDEGRVVGSLTNLPTLAAFRGAEVRCVTGRAWAVRPEYRGVALWLMDEYFQQSDVDLFINNTVNSLAVATFTAFGSKPIPTGDWTSAAFAVTNHRGFAASALRIKGAPAPGVLGLPVGWLLRGRDALRTTPRPPASGEGQVVALDAFDERFDAFWAELLRQRRDVVLPVRDRETLAWHFASPQRRGELGIYAVCDRGLVRSYLIAKRQDHEPAGLTRMRIVDFQTLEPDAPHLARLAAVVHDRCVAERIHVLELVGCGLPRMAAFETAAPYRRKLPAWPYYYKCDDPSIDSLLSDPRAWDPTSYDGDASI